MKKKSPLEEVFSLLYPNYPHPVSPHKKAELVINNLNVPLIGEERAFLVCCDIILRVPFPNEKREEKTRIVGRAENLLPEILGTNPDHEVHMDEVAHWEMRYYESGNFENFLKKLNK